MAGVVDLLTGDTMRTVVIAEVGLGLLSSTLAADPSVALGLFGLVAIIQGHQELIKLFIFFNAISIVLDVLRLAMAPDGMHGFFLLVLLQIAGMLCKAYVTYQCYDLFGFGSGSTAGGDGTAYQPAPGPRQDPFYEPPPANPNMYQQQPREQADTQL